MATQSTKDSPSCPGWRLPENEIQQEVQQEKSPALENIDAVDGFIADRLLYRQISLTDAMDDNNRSYVATANKDNIREIGRILAAIGDKISEDYELKWKKELEEKKRGKFEVSIEKFKKLRNTVDTYFEYLEYIGKRAIDNAKMYESALRGIFNFSELVFQLEIFTFLKFVVKCIDVPEDPYPAERKFIKDSLGDIEKQETQIETLIEEAEAILTRIVKDKVLDITKAREFDDVMRRARLAVNFCRQHLQSVEPVIEELLQKTESIKWFSRGIRVGCMGITWSYLYGKYKESNVSLPVALAGGVMAGFVWLSLFPSRSYKLYDSLRELQCMNKRLNEKLEELRVRMESDQCQKDKIIKDSNDICKQNTSAKTITAFCSPIIL